MIFWRLRAWWWKRQRPPVVIISRSGELTDRPQVHVSAAGRGASQTVYTWDANDPGEACASMYGKGLAEIFDVPLIDQRDPEWPRAN